jgi:hypothetical protein
MTGRQKAQQQKAAREEQAERAAEMSMMAGADNEAEQNGVFDAQSGERVDSPQPTKTAVLVEERPKPGFAQPVDPLGGETILTGQEDPEVVEPIIAARKQFTPPPVTVRSSMVTIRVDADIEDMTYGMVNGEPNNFNFKEGLAYRVPLAVAEHLNERNLIRQWIAG